MEVKYICDIRLDSRQLVKKEVNRRDASVTDNKEICPGVGELREVALICRSESTQVFVPGFARGSKFFTAPGKLGTPTFHGNHVRKEARMSSIAVRKGMDQDQFVMKADGALVNIVGLVFQPMRGIAEKLREPFTNFTQWDAEILLRFPYVPAHFHVWSNIRA